MQADIYQCQMLLVFFHQDIFPLEYCHRPCSHHPLAPNQQHKTIYTLACPLSWFWFLSFASFVVTGIRVYLFYMYKCLGCVYVHGNTRSQKRVLDLLELELQMVVSHYIGTTNKTQVLCENSKCS